MRCAHLPSQKAVAKQMMLGLVAATLAFGSACRGSHVKPTVTCDGLRQVRLGMDREAVATLLGPPLASTGRFTPVGKDPADELWQFSTENHDPFYLFSYSDKMYADFRDGRLIRISSFRKLSQDPPQPRLFDLEYETAADGTRKEVRKEGRLFVEAFCPERPAKAE